MSEQVSDAPLGVDQDAVGDGRLRVRPVLKAYEQVAEQLREAIATSELLPGQRLPTESALAKRFGVSRATIREALRILAAHNLIRTTKGATGGSFVMLPTVDHISEFVRANINLLTEAQDVSLEEFFDAREVLEIPAVRFAAQRRTPEEAERLRASVPASPYELSTSQQWVYNNEFHSVVVELSRNKLLYIAAQPLFSVLQTNLARDEIGRNFHQTTTEHHRRIAEAVAAGDADTAAEEMSQHLRWLRGEHAKTWRHGRTGTHDRRTSD